MRWKIVNNGHTYFNDMTIELPDEFTNGMKVMWNYKEFEVCGYSEKKKTLKMRYLEGFDCDYKKSEWIVFKFKSI